MNEWRFLEAICRKNWEDPEYASMGKKVRLEGKLLQLVIIFRMIATQAQNFFSFSSSISSKGGNGLPHLLYPC